MTEKELKKLEVMRKAKEKMWMQSYPIKENASEYEPSDQMTDMRPSVSHVSISPSFSNRQMSPRTSSNNGEVKG